MSDDFLPAVYKGIPPVHRYDTPQELVRLQRIHKQVRVLHDEFEEMLTTFGPKPDIQFATWQEDMHILLHHLDARITECKAAIKKRRRTSREEEP